MKKKYTDTTSFIPDASHPVIEAFLAFSQLKNLYRQGWLQRGIPENECDSVADHSFGVAMLGYIIAHEYRSDLDSAKVMMLGLFHEIGEIYGGDVTPRDGVDPDDKAENEYQSAKEVSSHLLEPEKYLKLWQEFEYQESAEAVFVNQIDKLEMMLQARLYEEVQHKGLDEFFDYVRERVTSSELQPIVESLLEDRKS